MIENFLNLFMFWFIYSFLGWICEIVYAFLRGRGYFERNSSLGPINPGYGIAAIILLTVLDDFKDNPFFVFVVGGLIATILEFIVHWFFERFQGARLWDYSDSFMNIQGRVCLRNSLLFGLLCVLMINLVHPILAPFVYGMPNNFKFIFAFVVTILYTMELVVVFLSVRYLRGAAEEIANLWDMLVAINPSQFPNFREYMEDVAQESIDWYDETGEQLSDDFVEKYDLHLDLDDGDYADERDLLFLRLSQLIEEKFTKRNIHHKIIYRVFPDLKSTDHKEIFEVMKEVYHRGSFQDLG